MVLLPLMTLEYLLILEIHLKTPVPPPQPPPPPPPYGHDKGIFCYLKSVVIILDFKHSKHAINK